MTTRSDTGGAFPLLWFGDDSVIALASHCPLLWNFSALVMVDEDYEHELYRLTLPTRRWLYNYLPCHGSLERPPGRLNMKEALVAHPPPWL